MNMSWREALETLPTVYVLYVYMYISVHTHTNTLHMPIHICIIDCSREDSGGHRWFNKDIFFLSLFLLESILSHFNWCHTGKGMEVEVWKTERSIVSVKENRSILCFLTWKKENHGVQRQPYEISMADWSYNSCSLKSHLCLLLIWGTIIWSEFKNLKELCSDPMYFINQQTYTLKI